ncbi:MAG: hypothetical protein PHD61_06790 [Bacteroidales bacterium]|nr:hypothetical protein [Lentimicrobiaceae bacterium]MDD5694995.1 hypothetical protein [Bacteroidales bacterium]
MMTRNKLDKSFGPVGTFAGVILCIAGIILIYFYITGIIILLLGAFVGFTSTSAIIDYNKKRIRLSTDIFGIIPTGTWIHVVPEMKLGIKESNQTYRAYSQGNRPLDIKRKDYRIILFDSDGKELMPLKKFDTLEPAIGELDILTHQLGLTKG